VKSGKSIRTGKLLELAYQDFHSHYHRELDPVSFCHRYPDPKDKEIVALLAAVLSYGNVRTILTSVQRVLAPLGPRPSQALREREIWPELAGFRHRFTTDQDIEILFAWLGSALREQGSLEKYFAGGAPSLTGPLRGHLSSFILRFTSQSLPSHLQSVRLARERNLKYLLSDPERGSACKRLNMFLRWVVRREDSIDLGLWKCLKEDQLMLPVDTHLLKILRQLGWTRSKQANWKVVEAATAKLREVAPDDPIRFDFSLCHLGMNGKSLKDYHAQLE